MPAVPPDKYVDEDHGVTVSGLNKFKKKDLLKAIEDARHAVDQQWEDQPEQKDDVPEEDT